MPWWVWYNPQSGQPAQAIDEPNAGAVQAATGFPELAGPFKTKAEAQASIDTKFKSTKPTHPIGDPLAPLGQIGDFFHRITEKETWTRIGEVALGGILLYVGVRAITHGSSTVGSQARKSATKPVSKIATKAVKVAVPEARLASRAVAKRAAPKTTARVATHRARAKKYGAKTPYTAPAPRPPTQRVSHVYYHAAPRPKKPPKVTP